MTATLALIGHALRESVRRRLFLIVTVVSCAFLVLYSVVCVLVHRQVHGLVGGTPGREAASVAAATVFGLSMFTVYSLASALAVFLTFAAVSSDADRGLLQPVVVRPVGRGQFLVARWVGAALVAAVYAIAMYAITLGVTEHVTGWHPARSVAPGLDLALGASSLAALCLLGSVILAFAANGSAGFMLYGIGQIGGIFEQIGHGLGNHTLDRIGHDITWALPFQAMYQQSLESLTHGATGLAGFALELGPLGVARDGGPMLIVWTVCYVAATLALGTYVFSRKDL